MLVPSDFTIGFDQLTPDEQLTLMSFSPYYYELVLPEYVPVTNINKTLIALRNKGLITLNKPPCKLTNKGIKLFSHQMNLSENNDLF